MYGLLAIVAMSLLMSACYNDDDLWNKVDELETKVEANVADIAILSALELTIEKKTGARGLRGIMENVLMNIMYETPSDHTISKVIITKECVLDNASPEIVRDDSRKPNVLLSKKLNKTNSKKAI